MGIDPTHIAVYLAAAGPITASVEAAAASVGAGMLLGGSAAGLLGSVFGWRGLVRDEAITITSSFAGLVVAILLGAEAIIR
jgi:hypothetical protein